jgi:hypothetical protein
MSEEQDPDQLEPETQADSAESAESVQDKNEPYIDQDMANEYGFTPQQAKAMSLYL